MKKIIFAFIALLWHSLLFSQHTATNAVYFQTDASVLSEEAQKELEKVSSTMLSSPDYELRIEAYTDDRGSEVYNQRLAEERAAAVQAFLTQKGVETSKISTKSWGEIKQSQAQNSEEIRQKNRRVDLMVTIYRFEDLAALQKRLLQRAERTFTLDKNTQQQEVKAAAGTTIIVPPNSFVLPDGSLPKGPVTLTVTEALKPSDWILNGLTTMSNGQILQSGGMVKISAMADGQELTLADGARLTVAIPSAKTVDPDMQLFYGNHSENNKGGINWQNTQTGFRQTMIKKTFEIKVSPEMREHFTNLKVPQMREPVFPQNLKLPEKPTKPTPPLMPRKPTKPTWEQTLKELGTDQSLQHISNKRIKKAKTVFAKQLTNYKRDSINYEKGYSLYLVKFNRYNQALTQFQKAETAWKELAKSRIKMLLDYENQVYYYLYFNNLRSTIKIAANHLETEAQNLRSFVNTLNQATLNRYLQGYQMSNRMSQKYNKRSEPGEDYFQQSKYRLYERKYVEALGLDFVKGPAFYRLEGQAIFEMQQVATLEKNIDSILVKIGFKSISDSLQILYNQKVMEDAKTPQEKQQVVSAYITDIQDLGWINVDKFAKMTGERAPLTVQETDDVRIYVTIKSINGILPLLRQHDNNVYRIEDLPKGTKVTVVGVKIKDGMAQMALQDAVVGETPTFQLNYKTMTLNALGNELKRLNG